MRTPHELILMVADYLDLKDVNSLKRTSDAMNTVLTLYMYRRAKDQKSIYGRPYILRAVDRGSLTVIKRLIEFGSSVNMSDTTDPFLPTSLHSCVKRGDISIARLLIQNKVDISPMNTMALTPLHFAVGRIKPPNEEMVRLLLDAGANISASSRCCFSVLHAATMDGTTAIVELLLQRGAILTICRHDGNTLLHCAASHATGATVQLFLQAGLDIEATNHLGETPLHCAAAYDRKDAIEKLLQCNANVHASDNQGLTPLQTFVKGRPSASAAHRILHHVTHSDENSWKGSEKCVPICQYVGLDVPVVNLLLSAGASATVSQNSTPSALAWATTWVNNH
jgi:ankyrin repeat protein